ncbi:MAG: DUF4397 domain-containing protein [Chitinophagaceae bacterium]
MMKMQLMRKLVLPATVLLFSGLLFSSCNKFDDDGGDNNNIAGLMAFNLSIDQSPVNFVLNGSIISNVPLGYDNYTGSYIAVFAGDRQLATYNTISSSPLVSADVRLDTNLYYSVFFAGANNNYRNIVVHDNYNGLSASTGMAYIRYVQAIPDSAAQQVKVSVDGTPYVNDFAIYGRVSNFLPVSPGSLTIEVNSATIDTSRTFPVQAKKVYTLLVVGKPGATNPERVPQVKFIENGTLPD